MKTTEVFELSTTEDVDRFCDLLKRLKSIAPSSLRYTVAVTAERRVTFKEAPNGAARRTDGRATISFALKRAAR